MTLSICDNPDVLSTMRIVKICIQIIKVLVPLILIVTIPITYTKAIAGKDEEVIKKAHKSMVTKLIAAAIVFLVPTFVGIIAKLTYTQVDYMKCIASANKEGIDDANYEEARLLVTQAQKSLLESDYTNAKIAVDKIQDVSKRNELVKVLNNVAQQINERTKKQQQSQQQQQDQARQDAQQHSQQQNQAQQQSQSQTQAISPQVSTPYTYSIFMGDSRTVGMKSKTNSQTDFVIALSGANYTHLDDHFNQAKNILNKYPNTKFNIILNYGVNMPSGISTYCSKYQNFVNSISNQNRIFIVSVNPVDDNRSKYVKNTNVVAFNNKIKTCVTGSNVYYCDVNNAAPLSTWISSYISDGVHYTSAGYQFIYSQINKCIGK